VVRVAHKELVSMGINTIGDLSRTPINVIESKFGEIGKVIHNMANGIDERPVVPNQEPKSIGRETTFRKDIDDPGILRSTMLLLSQRVAMNLRLKKYNGRVITLKVRFSDFSTITRRLTLKNHTYGIFDIYRSAVYLLEKIDLNRKKIRLIGISVSSLKPSLISESIFYSGPSRDENLTDAINRISDKFGEDKLTLARIIGKEGILD
jgi:DNA polymerase-4